MIKNSQLGDLVLIFWNFLNRQGNFLGQLSLENFWGRIIIIFERKFLKFLEHWILILDLEIEIYQLSIIILLFFVYRCQIFKFKLIFYLILISIYVIVICVTFFKKELIAIKMPIINSLFTFFSLIRRIILS